jgi:hypothetical protein
VILKFKIQFDSYLNFQRDYFQKELNVSKSMTDREDEVDEKKERSHRTTKKKSNGRR